MRPDTVRALRAIDQRFYQRHAAGFAGSRRLPWPGWKRAFAHLPASDAPLRVLDAGCAHARLALDLVTRFPGRSVDYVGMDSCLPLLARAGLGVRGVPRLRAHLILADLLAPLPCSPASGFSLIALFGVLHHIPGEANRQQLVERLAQRLHPDGILVLTAWRVERQARFADKRIPWDRLPAGTPQPDPDDLDPGDHLLVWGDDRETPRYCHAMSDHDVDALVPTGSVTLADRFESDGHRNDRNRYLVLRRG